MSTSNLEGQGTAAQRPAIEPAAKVKKKLKKMMKRPSLQVDAHSRHSLTARLNRAVGARAGLQFVASQFRGDDGGQNGAAGVVGEMLGIASKGGGGGLFNKGVLEPHISSALGNSVGPWSPPSSTQQWLPFTRVVQDGREGGVAKLSGTHVVAKRTVLEADVDATWQRFLELSARLTHTTPRLVRTPHHASLANALPDTAHVTLCAASDLRQRHRLALETQLGDEGSTHNFSTVAAIDFTHRPSWGIASSHQLGPNHMLFLRHTSDLWAKKLIVQSVYKPRERHTLSTIFAAAKSRPIQAGVSWKALLSPPGDKSEESFQAKALCSRDGSWAINFSMVLGGKLGAQ